MPTKIDSDTGFTLPGNKRQNVKDLEMEKTRFRQGTET